MADLKISQLTAITTLTPATDVLPVVDVTGTTKKITTNQILGSGGTATLASATISGDLTVRTNKLAVTSTGVGCGTATPGTSLEVWKDLIRVNSDAASGVYGTQFWRSGVERGRYGFDFSASLLELQADGDIRFLTGGETERYRIDSTGVSTWSVAGTTAMTLNASGLGVGEAASVSRFQSRGSTSDSSAYVIYAKNSGGSVINFMRNDGRFIVGNGTTDNLIVTETGNVGIGVTPSAAWNAGGNIQVGNLGALYTNNTLGATDLAYNSIRTGADTYQYLFGSSVAASRFQQRDGSFRFFTAPAGTSPTAITFTQAMTLDASGRLLVGSTSAFTDLTGSKEVKIGDGGMQTFTSAISAATPTNIARGGVGGLVYVGGYNGTGQYGAVVLWTAASATVVSVINGTGSTITFGVSGGFLQITSSLALTSVGANCIRL